MSHDPRHPSSTTPGDRAAHLGRGDVAPLHLEIRRGTGVEDVTVWGASSQTSILEFTTALGIGTDGLINGANYSGASTIDLVGLATGSIVESAAAAAPHRNDEDRPVVMLEVVSGPYAGRRHRLDQGIYVISDDGRVETLAVHAKVQDWHALFATISATGHVRIASVGGPPVRRGANVLDSAIAAGEELYTVGTADVRFRRATSTTPWLRPQRFVRPPRTMPQADDPPVDPPALPILPAGTQPLPLLSILMPIPVGLAMAALVNPMFALFTLMSPTMAVGRWAEARFRNRRETRRHEAKRHQLLGDFASRLNQSRELSGRRLIEDHPSSSEARSRVLAHDERLWQRRPTHRDFGSVTIGFGSPDWRPPVVLSGEDRWLDDTLSGFQELPGAPVVVDFLQTSGLGVIGDRTRGLSLLRAVVVQIVTERAPSDLAMHVFSRQSKDWDWMKWLPHLSDGSGAHRFSIHGAAIDMTSCGTHVVLIDGTDLLYGQDGSLRKQVMDELSVWPIIFERERRNLPACCDLVVELGSGSDNVFEASIGRSAPLRPDGMNVDDARQVARSLALLRDPDESKADRQLPFAVGLTALLGTDAPSQLERYITNQWAENTGAARLDAIIGIGGDGPHTIDLVRDGPHALVAGTTGSGKSELLRTLVASLALRHRPTEVNFLLIDFKGGGAFDACSLLPHTVAVVTDLDDHLADRALRSLRAELRRREEMLRENETSDLTSYCGREPLPRLVVVVDEFATLASELPTFLQSLVDVAQRGRSLGVHLVLATQRPSGVLDAKIRANTNLRIALRVQDDGDSIDVIGTRDAARIAKAEVGRAIVRTGNDDAKEVQIATTSLRIGLADGPTIGVEPFHLLPQGCTRTAERPNPALPTELAALIQAVVDTHRQTSSFDPRPIWHPPLPDSVLAEHLADRSAPGELDDWCVAFGLRDVPDEQRQVPAVYDAHSGNLALYGSEGSAVSSALGQILVGFAASHPPTALHLHAIDAGAGALAPLASLPHLGAYCRADDMRRIERLVRRLAAELDDRREVVARNHLSGIDAEASRVHGVPLIMLAIDNTAALVDVLGDIAPDSLEDLFQVLRDGPALGIVGILSAPHERAIPGRVLSSIANRIVLRLADPTAHSMFGIRATSLPPLGGMRAYDATDATHLTLAGLGPTQFAVARSHTKEPGSAEDIEVLGDHVDLLDLPAAFLAGGHLAIPIARDEDLRPVTLEVVNHCLISGASKSGKTTALISIATQLRRSDDAFDVIAVARSRESPLAVFADRTICPEESFVVEHHDLTRQSVILVDDAELIGEPMAKALQRLLELRADTLHVFAAGRPEELRHFQSWTAVLRAARTGLLLRPQPGDADLLRAGPGHGFARRHCAGRALVVSDGVATVGQVARCATRR